jgi:hypothetical protein
VREIHGVKFFKQKASASEQSVSGARGNLINDISRKIPFLGSVDV